MGKEGIINKLPRNREYNMYIHESDVESALDEYAEKVAVAFAEWKDKNTTKNENGCFVIWYRNADAFAYDYSDLYQYFIENIYNK